MKLEDEQTKELESLAKHLGGEITYLSTYDQSGRTSKKIVIEYDIKGKE